MYQNSVYKLTAQILGIFVAVVLFGRFTWSYGFAVIALAAIYFAMIERPGPLILCAVFLHFIVMANPIVVLRLSVFTSISRYTVLLIEALLIFIGMKRSGKDVLPLVALLLYLVVAVISSIAGYMPLISFFKLFSFTLFLLSIYIGTKNLSFKTQDCMIVRAGILALAIIIIFGSLLTLPFPAIAYYTSLRGAVRSYGMDYAASLLASNNSVTLFTGITIHSQFLGPVLACIGTWLLCDMLLVEKRLSLLHILLILPLPVMLYMTRARIGLLSMVIGLVLVYFYLIPRGKFDKRTSVGVLSFMFLLLLSIVIVGTVLELRGGYLSKWVRKTEDVKSDSREFVTAVTDSRQGVISECMKDFEKNRILGKGFQVMERHPEMYRNKRITIFSAPIEKGVLPIMILGETGIIGLIAFVLFVIHFLIKCGSRDYLATITCFCVFLGTNMAEATFFSPGGGGGVFWQICIVGGFIIDMVYRNQSVKSPQIAPRFEEEVFFRDV